MAQQLPTCLMSAWESYATELYAFVTKELGKNLQYQEFADDILQDIFIKAANQGYKFCDIKQPRAWFYQVAKNSLIDKYRKEQKMPTVLIETWEDDVALQQLNQANNVDETPIQSLDVCLSKNLETLAVKDRDIIECCDLQGIAQTTYALNHDLTLPAVKSRLQRARVQLKQNIIKNCNVTFDAQGQVCDYTAKTCL